MAASGRLPPNADEFYGEYRGHLTKGPSYYPIRS